MLVTTANQKNADELNKWSSAYVHAFGFGLEHLRPQASHECILPYKALLNHLVSKPPMPKAEALPCSAILPGLPDLYLEYHAAHVSCYLHPASEIFNLRP